MKLHHSLSLITLLFAAHSAFADFPRCDVINSDPFWIDNGTMIATCPTACSDGSFLQCEVHQQQLVQCQNGDLMLLDQVRPGGVIHAIGTCPIIEVPPPRACGDHPHGSQWWHDTSRTMSEQCNTCPDGSPQMCEKKVQALVECRNGDIVELDHYRNGDVIRFENECAPLPPRTCGDKPSGVTWWTDAGTQTAICETCWDHSNISCTYHTQIQEMCNDGVVTSTGSTQRGSLISKNGQCPAEPRNCGDVSNGATTWQGNGQTHPYQCGTCIDGSPQMCVAILEREMKCSDGTLNPTGFTRRGAEIGPVNTCPNVVHGEESYEVPVRGAKVDVLFVFDTTPLMTRTILKMADRFKSLLSSWTNIDWQVGISNAAPDFDLLHGSNGNLLKMNPGSVPAPNPLMFLTPQQQAADWIFGQNVSYRGTFPPAFYCNNPPYCEYNFPEPLRELTVAFRKRDSQKNQGFFRPGATLVPVIVSAHDERFTGPFDLFSTKPKDVVSAFKRDLSDMAGMRAYSIAIPPGDTKCWWKYNNALDMGVGGHYGRLLSEFANSTGGKTISICEKDYATALSGLSQDLAQKINSIELKHVPYGDSLKIQFTPAVNGITWTVQGKKVTFSKDLPPGTSLAIRYLHAP